MARWRPDLKESEATSERLWLRRRDFLKLGAGSRTKTSSGIRMWKCTFGLMAEPNRRTEAQPPVRGSATPAAPTGPPPRG